MFESLTEKLNAVFKRLMGQGTLSDQNMSEALKTVRMALLEADVHFTGARDFVEAVRVRALGQEVRASLTPGQQVVKIVREELTRLLGGAWRDLALKGTPALVMLVGLHGSGKTTTAGKLGRYLVARGRRPLLVGLDVTRPAALEQLRQVGALGGLDVYDGAEVRDPVRRCEDAVGYAARAAYDVCVLDTAGRLAIENALMDELDILKAAMSPREVLLVADGMTGQDAVTIGTAFHRGVGLTGVILTKLDGDARGGAALSFRSITGVPILFAGVGETLDALEPFHPDRIASRILGMGDLLTFIEKAEAAYEAAEKRALTEKVRRDSFTLEDFRDELRRLRSLGSLDEVLRLIPGVEKLLRGPAPALPEKDVIKVEAIINSMTPEERRAPGLLNARRRERIARGSGTSVRDVNQVVKQFAEMRKMMKRFRAGPAWARGLPRV